MQSNVQPTTKPSPLMLAPKKDMVLVQYAIISVSKLRNKLLAITTTMNQSRNAYVLSCDFNSDRTNFSCDILENIGFNPVKIACAPHTNVITSNRLGHESIYQQISQSKDNWGYVFEDDINIIEDVKLDEVIEYEKISKNFFYLGCCINNPRETLKKTSLKIRNSYVYNVKGGSRCLHGIGISKEGCKNILNFSKTWRSRKPFDACMDAFVSIHSANIVRGDLQSPLNRRHFGFLYQDRLRFPTSIWKSNI